MDENAAGRNKPWDARVGSTEGTSGREAGTGGSVAGLSGGEAAAWGEVKKLKTVAVLGICPMCRKRVLEGQETFLDKYASISHATCLRGHFKTGDRVKVLILGENDGRIGRIVGVRTELPTCYWVRFNGPREIGCIWDYYFDEIEGVDSWQRV